MILSEKSATFRDHARCHALEATDAEAEAGAVIAVTIGRVIGIGRSVTIARAVITRIIAVAAVAIVPVAIIPMAVVPVAVAMTNADIGRANAVPAAAEI